MGVQSSVAKRDDRNHEWLKSLESVTFDFLRHPDDFCQLVGMDFHAISFKVNESGRWYKATLRVSGESGPMVGFLDGPSIPEICQDLVGRIRENVMRFHPDKFA